MALTQEQWLKMWELATRRDWARLDMARPGYDIAVEAMANALERHLLAYEGNLRPVNWTGAAMIALEAAEEAVRKARGEPTGI